MTATNTFGRQVVLPMTNKSGGGVIAGDVVIIDTANALSFTTTTSAASTALVGIAQETIASNGVGRVLLSGYAALVNVNASVTLGNYGQTHTVAKQAASAGATRQAGTFCQFLTGGTTPDAMIWPTDLGGGSGAPTNADYLVGTANGSLSAEIVVGTSPGGELGGTWASPTVDTVHSGSAHGLVYTSLGTTAAGASFATAALTYLKKVTVPVAGIITEIGCQVKGPAGSSSGIYAALFSDTAGVPVLVLNAAGSPVDPAAGRVANVLLNTTVRRFSLSCGYKVTATDYWLAIVLVNTSASLAYNSGTGSDKTQNITAPTDVSVSATSDTTNDYCIFATLIS